MVLDYFPDEIDYAARVAKGVELLDEKFPDWWKRINLDILDVSDGLHCVTAQSAQILEVGNNWLDGADYFGLTSASNDVNTNTYIAHGFNAEDIPWVGEFAQTGWGDYSNAFALATLTDIWHGVILERRAALSITL